MDSAELAAEVAKGLAVITSMLFIYICLHIIFA